VGVVIAMAVPLVRSVSDIHETLSALEVGSSLTRYCRNKRPESRMFRVMLETRELVWSRSVGGKPEGIGMFNLNSHLNSKKGHGEAMFTALFYSPDGDNNTQPNY